MPKDPVDRLREICLALPEAEERPFGGHTAPSFRVRDRFFVMLYEDHSAFTCKAPPGAQEALVRSDPDRFFVPPYVGHKGWVGVRLAGRPDWEEIAELVEESWRMTAPKRVVRAFDASGPVA